MFNEKSGLVQVWARIIKQSSKYTINDVPDIDNLKEMVLGLLEK